jgi:hypothetical protein
VTAFPRKLMPAPPRVTAPQRGGCLPIQSRVCSSRVAESAGKQAAYRSETRVSRSFCTC